MVSIHAFRGEGDQPSDRWRWRVQGFNPRLPGGRRLRNRHNSPSRTCVSIHAFRGEGDRQGAKAVAEAKRRFNPRLPGGRRLRGISMIFSTPTFQSTPSGGKATRQIAVFGVKQSAFQSTPSGGKATLRPPQSSSRLPCFNPRLPGGRRRRTPRRHQFRRRVSIHAFRGEGDRMQRIRLVVSGVSIHAFRGEGDTITSGAMFGGSVSIHAFRGEGDVVISSIVQQFDVSIHAFRGEGDQIRFGEFDG